MDNYAKELLTDSEIVNELEKIILEKARFIELLKEQYERLKDRYNNMQTDEITKHFIELYLFEFKGGKQLQQEEKYLNNMCISYAEAVNLLSTKRHFTNWNDIQEKLERIDIVKLLSRYLIIENTKRNIKCPLHDDKSPSFKIYSNTNSWFCFGCQKGGKPVNFVMAMEGLTYKEAVKRLLNMFY